MEKFRNETNEALIYRLIRLELEKHDNWRNDGYYQEEIEAVQAEILRRMKN